MKVLVTQSHLNLGNPRDCTVHPSLHGASDFPGDNTGVRLVPNRERSTSRLYIVTMLI